MPTADGKNHEEQSYKYSEKEYDTMLGMNMYDFHARQYDPPTIRFRSPDPMAEEYYSISPYVYCANNPIKFIDLDGRKILGTDRKPVSFSPNTGWSSNASKDVMKVGNAMMLSETATQQLNIMLSSEHDITISVSEGSLKNDKGNYVFGRTREALSVSKDGDKVSYQMTIYEGSIEKGINMTDSQAEKSGSTGAKYQGLTMQQGIAATAAHEAVHTQQQTISNTNPNFDPEKDARKVENKVLDELRTNKK